MAASASDDVYEYSDEVEAPGMWKSPPAVLTSVGVVVGTLVLALVLLYTHPHRNEHTTLPITLPSDASLKCATDLKNAVGSYGRVLEELFIPAYGRRPLRLVVTLAFPSNVTQSVVIARRSLFAAMSTTTSRWANRASLGLFALTSSSVTLNVDPGASFVNDCVVRRGGLDLAYALLRLPREAGWRSASDLAPIACVAREPNGGLDKLRCMRVMSHPRFGVDEIEINEDHATWFLWALSSVFAVAFSAFVVGLWTNVVDVLRSQSVAAVKGENAPGKLSAAVRTRTGLRILHVVIPTFALYVPVLRQEDNCVQVFAVGLLVLSLTCALVCGVAETPGLSRIVIANYAGLVGFSLVWVAIGLFFHPVVVTLRLSVALSLSAYIASTASFYASLKSASSFAACSGPNSNAAFRACFSSEKLRADFKSRRFLRNIEERRAEDVGLFDNEERLYGYLKRRENSLARTSGHEQQEASSGGSYYLSYYSEDEATPQLPLPSQAESLPAREPPPEHAQTEEEVRIDLDYFRVALLPEVVAGFTGERLPGAPDELQLEARKFVFRSLVAEYLGELALSTQDSVDAMSELKDGGKVGGTKWRNKLDDAYGRAETRARHRLAAAVVVKASELVGFVLVVYFVAPAVLDGLVPGGLLDSAEQIALLAGLALWRVWGKSKEDGVDVVAEVEALLAHGVDPRTKVAVCVGPGDKKERKEVSAWQLLAAFAARDHAVPEEERQRLAAGASRDHAVPEEERQRQRQRQRQRLSDEAMWKEAKEWAQSGNVLVSQREAKRLDDVKRANKKLAATAERIANTPTESA